MSAAQEENKDIQGTTPQSTTRKKKGKKNKEIEEDKGPKWEGTFTGNLVDGIRSGKGQCTYPNGDIYNGDFRNGMRDGHGVYLQVKTVASLIITTAPFSSSSPTKPFSQLGEWGAVRGRMVPLNAARSGKGEVA
jgi:hypothetical protein